MTVLVGADLRFNLPLERTACGVRSHSRYPAARFE